MFPRYFAEQIKPVSGPVFCCSHVNFEALFVHALLGKLSLFPLCAYKTDDGALSLDEFKAFFSDGILSNEDLEKLFHDIDTHNTK